MSRLFAAVSLLLALACSSCSVVLDRATSRHRDVLEAKSPLSRDECRRKIGTPVETWERNNGNSPNGVIREERLEKQKKEIDLNGETRAIRKAGGRGSHGNSAFNEDAYDVFLVRGRLARPGDGSAQAITDAVTLGVGEVIALPCTVLIVAGKPFIKENLVIFYDKNFRYKNHVIFDENWKKVDSLGF